MNLNQLRYFVEAVSSGNFTSAGKNLFATPQAISKAINDLEKELQVELFYRKGNKVEPTSAGKLLAHKASEVLSGIEDIRSIAELYKSPQKQTGRLSLAIAVSPYRGSMEFGGYLDGFKNAFPFINVESLENFSSICATAVQDGLVDIAITTGRFNGPDIKCLRVFDIELIVALSELHPLTVNEEIRSSDLGSYPVATPSDLGYLYHLLKAHFSNRRIDPTFIAVAPSVSSHMSFMKEKNGVIYVANDPESIKLYQGITTKRFIAEDRISLPVCLVYSKSSNNPTIPTFIDYMLKQRYAMRQRHLYS